MMKTYQCLQFATDIISSTFWVFDPVGFMARLAALISRPRVCQGCIKEEVDDRQLIGLGLAARVGPSLTRAQKRGPMRPLVLYPPAELHARRLGHKEKLLNGRLGLRPQISNTLVRHTSCRAFTGVLLLAH